ncbi:MAG: hypothetical protein M0P74_11345 [Syntrophales bacterium]|nr:hypothetical protein [Syntrophales bacterium]
MNPDLEKRLRTVYPTGRLEKPDRRRLRCKAFETAVYGAVREIAAATSAAYDEFPGCWWEISRILEFDFTLPGPRQEDWERRFDDARRIAWLKENDRVYAVLNLKVSKVYPAYSFCFATWRLVGRKEIDCDTCYGLPGPSWAPFFQELIARFKHVGLVQLKEGEREEKVPFVRCEKWDQDGDEDGTILVPVTVHQCLFEEI